MTVGLNFTDWDLGIISIGGAVMAWAGVVVFKALLFDTGWRYIYIYTTAVMLVFSLLQIILVMQWNKLIGLPDIIFALGDSSFMYFIQSIQFLPTCIMYLMLCPDGSEGLTYATLTTIANLASTVSYDISTLFSYIWDTSNETLEKGDFSGVLKLTLLTRYYY